MPFSRALAAPPAPYWRQSRIFVKERWLGLTAAEALKELGGTARLSDSNQCDHKLGNGETLNVEFHMHEPPVSLDYKVIKETLEFLVVHKPSGLTTHPTGPYNKNTLTELLKPLYGSLTPCYRLDRLTSGVLIFAKEPRLVKTLRAMPSEKTYLARIQKLAHSSAFYLNKTTALEYTLFEFNAKLGYEKFATAATQGRKEAQTLVTPKQEFEDGSLLVECQIPTGRNHQIRRHLNLHGWHIINDPIYSSDLYRNLYFNMCQQEFDRYLEGYNAGASQLTSGKKCTECGSILYDNKAALDEMLLCCYSYKLGESVFVTDLPDWAQKLAFSKPSDTSL